MDSDLYVTTVTFSDTAKTYNKKVTAVHVLLYFLYKFLFPFIKIIHVHFRKLILKKSRKALKPTHSATVQLQFCTAQRL